MHWHPRGGYFSYYFQILQFIDILSMSRICAVDVFIILARICNCAKTRRCSFACLWPICVPLVGDDLVHISKLGARRTNTHVSMYTHIIKQASWYCIRHVPQAWHAMIPMDSHVRLLAKAGAKSIFIWPTRHLAVAQDRQRSRGDAHHACAQLQFDLLLHGSSPISIMHAACDYADCLRVRCDHGSKTCVTYTRIHKLGTMTQRSRFDVSAQSLCMFRW